MNILIISPGFHPVTGGHGGAVENLINIFLQENDEKYKNNVTVYSAKRGNSFDKQIYKHTNFRLIDIGTFLYKIKHLTKNLYRVLSGKSKQRYYINEIINDLKKKNEINYYDLIIFENGDEFISYFKKKTKTSSKIVLHLHNDHINVNNPNSLEIIDNVDEFWAVSKFIKNRIDGVKLTNKVKVLYNTIDYKLFKKNVSEEEVSSLKFKYNISKDDFVFIYVGRVMDDKGTLELVNAFDQLNKKYNNIKLLVVGGSISLKNDSDYLNKVRDVSINNKNIIFTGQIKNYDLYKFYQISNCQIIPSKWEEPFGLIALEGVASNIRIISSYSGGLPEIFENDCLYVDRKNLTEDLIKKMDFVINDKTSIDMVVYERIMNKFSKENYCDTFNSYIKEFNEKR